MSDDEHNEDLFRNWVKSARGLRCLKDGIETFVSDSMTDLYNRVVVCIQGKCGISALSCNKCKCAELLVVHEAGTNRTCNNNCLCQVKPRNRKPCPDNNACVRMYEYLIDEHQYKDPNMRNVNIGLWSTNPWEFAKGFINSPGYDKVDSAKSTDASGLLSICLNNKDINNTVSNPNTFRKVRTIRNTLIHSSTLEVSEADMTDYLKEMEKILSENILMTANNKDKVTKAINSLKQLPKAAMCTNCVQAIESRTDALQALSQEKQTLLELINEEPDSKEHQQELAEVLKLENKHNKAIVKNQTKYNSTIERYETKVTEIRHNRKSMQEDLTQKNIIVEPELQDALDFKVEILHTDRTGTKDDVPMASGSSLGEELVAQMQLKDPSLPLESRDKVDVVRAIENFGREIDGSPPLNVSQLVWDSIKSVVKDNTASLSWAEKQGRKMMSVLGAPAGEAEKLPISRGICGILSAVLKKQTKENRIMMVDVSKDSKLLMPDDQVKRQIDLAMAVTLVYVDTNDNLDLLNDSSLWKRKLWVHMTRMPLQLEYVTSVIDEQKPASTGFEGHNFKVKLPFSWVIKDTVDKITENITSQLKSKYI